MPAQLILHPFRLRVSGRVATAEQDSDAYIDSQLAVVVGTRLGEREMCESFGVPEAAFSHLAAADVQTCVDTFGPDGVEVTAVSTVQDDEFVEAVTLEWDVIR